MFRSLRKWLVGWLHGGPHLVVGRSDGPYMLRWYLLPRNPLCCIYLHKFLRSDTDAALHDHPWPSLSILLRGTYREHTPDGSKVRRPGAVVLRRATHTHRIEIADGTTAWTLFVTGPRVREWGFWCPRGWVYWKDFVSAENSGDVGRGCGESA